MGNKRYRRSRGLETPCPEREIERTQVETSITGNETLTNSNTVVREDLRENNSENQLTVPSQFCNEIQVWTQIMEQENDEKVENSNLIASTTTNPRSHMNEMQDSQPWGSKTNRSIGVHLI